MTHKIKTIFVLLIVAIIITSGLTAGQIIGETETSGPTIESTSTQSIENISSGGIGLTGGTNSGEGSAYFDEIQITKSNNGTTGIVDDFEDNNLNEYTDYSGSDGFITTQSSTVYEGTYAFQGFGDINSGIGFSENGLNRYPQAGDNFSYKTRTSARGVYSVFSFGVTSPWDSTDPNDDPIPENGYRISLSRQLNDDDAFVLAYTDNGQNTVLRLKNLELTTGVWYTVKVSWGEDGYFVVKLLDGNTEISRLEVQDNRYISGIDLDVSSYMDFNSTQPYEVTSNGNDITNSANVTSGNTDIITVSELNNTLTSHGQSGKVNISAEYSGFTDNETVFVGVATLENIENITADKYVTAFLGMQDSNAIAHYGPNGQYALGSQLQLILFSLIGGVIISDLYRNEYLGLATISILIIFWWALGYMSIGIVYLALIYSLLAGYLQTEIPSRSDTNVGGFP